MSKFFFDVDDGVCPTRDTEGQQFSDRQVASTEATGLLADIARDLALKGKCNDVTIDMRDDTGNVVFTATLSVKARWVNWKKVPAQPTGRLVDPAIKRVARRVSTARVLA